MIDIHKLAQLTGLQLTSDEIATLQPQLESVVSLLDKVKDYDLTEQTTTWHELLGLESIPMKDGNSDAIPDQILTNIAHTIVGHAVEVRAFVE